MNHGIFLGFLFMIMGSCVHDHVFICSCPRVHVFMTMCLCVHDHVFMCSCAWVHALMCMGSCFHAQGCHVHMFMFVCMGSWAHALASHALAGLVSFLEESF